MVKEVDENKAFEQELKGKMGWKCSCSLSTTSVSGANGPDNSP